ncbi:hypothetical protein BFJ71_g6544 [Fusarium oxysporum]|nr:hypothetical protein BFJ71_g6544 [Fusarium oxysporum]
MLAEVLRSVFDIASLKCAVLRILAKSVEDLDTLLQAIGKKLQTVDLHSSGLFLGPTGHPDCCLCNVGFEERMAALELEKDGLSFASGAAAILTVAQSLVTVVDDAVVNGSVHGGTYH